MISKNQAIITVVAILALALAFAVLAGARQSPPPRAVPDSLSLPAAQQEIHIHADFKVYLGGELLNFSQPQYMSKNGSELDLYMHLHDGNGNVIHQHKPNLTLSYFFSSLGMEFNSTCFNPGKNSSFCSNGANTLKLFVQPKNSDWRQNQQMGDYKFQDLDRILISYGNDSPSRLNAQMDSVTNDSCIYSGACPQRGISADESGCNSALGICLPGN